MSDTAVATAPTAGMRAESAFRPDIEGLRGIAVFIVVAFHCGIRGFSGGFVGVDVFFALSGYLITGLLLKEVERTSKIRLVNFYARRARRLLPASAFMLVVTIGVAALVCAPQELQFAGRAARATAVYLSNMFFALNAADYFAPGVETNPMLHTWSLAVEEQFYLFWPVLVLLAFRGTRSRKGLFAALSVLTVGSFAASVWMTYHGGTLAFYSLPPRAWEFGIGGLAAMVPVGTFRRFSGWFGLGGIGLAAVVLSTVFVSDTNFPGWVAAVPVVGTVIALIAGSEWAAARPARSLIPSPHAVLNTPVLQFLGRLSYSWYLWHWPFLVLGAALIPSLSKPGRIVAALLALGMAYVSYVVVEKPIRFHPKLVKKPRLSLAIAAGITVCTLAFSMFSVRYAGRLAAAPGMRNIAAVVDDIADMPRDKCVSLADSSNVKTCSYGSATAAKTVVLFGDSHAIQWFNPLRRIAESNGWRLVTKLKSGCPATDIAPPRYDDAKAASCASWRAAAIRDILELKPSLVVAASASKFMDYNRENGSQPIKPAEWRAGTRRMLSPLDAAGIPVAVMRDIPQPWFDVPACLGRSARHRWYPGGSCEFNTAAGLRPVAFAMERQAAAGLNNVHLIDMTDAFCRGAVCPVVQDGSIVYRDDNHMAGAFAAKLAPVLQDRLAALIGSR